jgi:hypothetical protein
MGHPSILRGWALGTRAVYVPHLRIEMWGHPDVCGWIEADAERPPRLVDRDGRFAADAEGVELRVRA